MRLRPAAFLALTLLALPARAEDTAEAPLPDMAEIERAWEAQDFEFVRSGLEQHATQTGTPLAQFRYGRVLLEGRGGPVDLDGAALWLERAVDQNHPEAATLLARLYLTEFDPDSPWQVQYDPERAAALLQMAAALGITEAKFQLARLYNSGTGVPQDARAAFPWLLAAAQDQHIEAQFSLALAYSQGLGVEADSTKAIAWLEQAPGNDHPRAQLSLARAYETGNGVAQSPARAADWYRRAAEGGHPLAQRILGMAYLTGSGAPLDPAEGLRWLTTAAQNGDTGAMYNLGLAYAGGDTLEQSDDAAATWYARAAESGLGRAQVALGTLYETGRGVDADMDQALVLYQRALETADRAMAARRLGQLAAADALGDRFAPDRMVPWVTVALTAGDAGAEAWLAAQAEAGLRSAQSTLAAHLMALPDRASEGAAYLEQAARAGDPQAQQRLGRMHMTGNLVTLDYVAAYGWFNIAAALGAVEAAELRDTAAALMTADQLAEGQAFSRRWFAEGEPQPPATDQTVRILRD